MKIKKKTIIVAVVSSILMIPLIFSLGLIEAPNLMDNLSFPQSTPTTSTVFINPAKVIDSYPPDPYLEMYDTFQVHVNISDVADLYTWNVNITWNRRILNFTRIVSYGDFLNQTSSPHGTSRIVNIISASNETGYAAIAETILGNYTGITGSGSLVTIEFLITGFGYTNLTISVSGTLPTKLLDSAGNSIEFSTVGSYFDNRYLADINRDGTINVIDLTIVSFSYGSIQGEPNYNQDADINKDEIVDMRDLFLVARNLGWTWT